MDFDEMKKWEIQEKSLKARRFKYLNALARKGQILFVGSSLMEQFPVHEILYADHSDAVIYNRGIGGYTIPEMEETAEEQIFELEPSSIFINIGTNDISDPACSVELLIERYEHLLRRIQDRLPEARIYVMAFYPANGRDVEVPDFIRDLLDSRMTKLSPANAALEKLCEKLQIRFIDVNRGLADETGCLKREYTIDGVHMYANGYQVVYQNMKPYIEEACSYISQQVST